MHTFQLRVLNSSHTSSTAPAPPAGGGGCFTYSYVVGCDAAEAREGGRKRAGRCQCSDRGTRERESERGRESVCVCGWVCVGVWGAEMLSDQHAPLSDDKPSDDHSSPYKCAVCEDDPVKVGLLGFVLGMLCAGACWAAVGSSTADGAAPVGPTPALSVCLAVCLSVCLGLCLCLCLSLSL